jgi:hypothetical protein
MFPHLIQRPSDSPFVERVWMTESKNADAFTSISTVRWSMVVAKWNGRITLSLHGPQTAASRRAFPPDAEWFGIEFKLGTFVPQFLPGTLIGRYINLPASTGRSFWLGCSAWQFPTFENADTFVDQLVRSGVVVQDPVISAIQQGQSPALSLRAIQYRFQHTTGLSQCTIRQIERARTATALLQQGMTILDTVYEAGYSDQAHLTRSLKHFVGHTPAEIPTISIVVA